MFRCLLITGFMIVCVFSFAKSQKPSIIPQPVSVKEGSGSFKITSGTPIELSGSNLTGIGKYLSQILSPATGFSLKINTVSSFSNGSIQLRLSGKPAKNKEAYELVVTPSAITITADSTAGLFYGIQTILQLLPKEIESKKELKNIEWVVPAVTINDYPRFAWRGAMLDVARHFFTKEEVKDFINNMVKYKFNVLHFHLTDDQGWRIEIKSLPQLTRVGAWRPLRTGKWGNTPKPDPSEPKTYGGYYTHDDIRELVKYAADRFMTILPEIEGPGHSLATIASYPELSCTDSNYYVSVGDKIINWHSKGFTALLDNTLCPANEKVYAFLDKVFTEVADLFPSEYIHMGGDECPKDFWRNNPQVKDLMQQENLKDMNEVQSYYVKRVEKILRSKGKKLIGWDEILEGGLPADAAVMSWRGMKGGVHAAKEGHKVVMSPYNHAYYDLYQGDPLAEPPTYDMLRLRDSYKFEPVPEGVDPVMVMGGQGNLWTEQIQNMRAVQYMVWPRALAVSESVWSPKDSRNWKNFVARVENQFERMDVADIKYSRSMFDPIFKTSAEGTGLKLQMETEIEGLDIFYSYDGSFPDNHYPKYTKPLIIPKDALDVRVVTYRDGKPVGKQIRLPVAELEKRVKRS
ncbi:MAG TPA: family 20 glycosylhydrolase [Flavitalea sp.]|nr:family 20 glycosylhydrolase [Flavitalea sp.]